MFIGLPFRQRPQFVIQGHQSILYRYDMDKSGAIDKKEMVKVMNSIYAMLGDESGGRSQKLNDLVCFDKTHKNFKLFLSRLLPMLLNCLRR